MHVVHISREELGLMCCWLFIVCFSEDDGPGQGGLYKKNNPVAAEWPGFRQTKLSGSQLRIGRGAQLSSDKERFLTFLIN